MLATLLEIGDHPLGGTAGDPTPQAGQCSVGLNRIQQLSCASGHALAGPRPPVEAESRQTVALAGCHEAIKGTVGGGIGRLTGATDE